MMKYLLLLALLFPSAAYAATCTPAQLAADLDGDGDVDAEDASRSLQCTLGLATASRSCDVDGDSATTIRDAVAVLQSMCSAAPAAPVFPAANCADLTQGQCMASPRPIVCLSSSYTAMGTVWCQFSHGNPYQPYSPQMKAGDIWTPIPGEWSAKLDSASAGTCRVCTTE